MAWKLEQIKGDLGHGKKDVPVQSETEKYCFLPFYSICVLIGLVVLTHMGKRGFLMILVNFYVYSMSWSNPPYFLLFNFSHTLPHISCFPVNTASVCMGIGPAAESWTAYQEPCSWKKKKSKTKTNLLSFLWQSLIVLSASLWVRLYEPHSPSQPAASNANLF